ncbi:MAG TPA: hypothetical protein VGK99_17415 [Acidobacteriota bacterium]|jgi:hypothetical protein
MAKVKRTTYFMANLQDKPGALLKVLQDLNTKKISLDGLWGFGTHGGQAQLFVVAKNPEKLRSVWKTSGLLAEEGTGFFVEGTDRAGALIKTLEKIAAAGINIHALDAVAVKGRFGSFVWVEGDVEKAAKALGA